MYSASELKQLGKMWALQKKIKALTKLIKRATAKRQRYINRLKRHQAE